MSVRDDPPQGMCPSDLGQDWEGGSPPETFQLSTIFIPLRKINLNANQHPKGHEADISRDIRETVLSTSVEIIESSSLPTF